MTTEIFPMKKHLKSVGFGMALVAGIVGSHAAESGRMLHDLSHGQRPFAADLPMGALLKKNGLTLDETKTPLTAEALAGVRVLYVRAPQTAFTPEETATVVEFVRKGGSLLLIVDEESRPGSPKAPEVNGLITPFGLKLTPDTPYLHNCGGLVKAGAINRADREIPYSGGRAVEGGKPFAWRLDENGKPAEAFATSTVLENGAKVVVMGEAMASLLVLGKPEGVRLTGVPRDPRNTTYWGKDSEVFMEEVLAWLAKPDAALRALTPR